MRGARIRFVATATAVGWLCSAAGGEGVAVAAGTELLPAGNQSVARGGAVAARAEDPTVLSNDPAGLALLSGNQLMLDVITSFQHMCVDPYGYYGWGAYGGKGSSEFGDQLSPPYSTTPLPEVCNSAKPASLPNLAWSGKITNDLGIGIGFVAPVTLPGFQYGGPDGTIQTPGGELPTPTRYSLVKQEVTFGLDPTIGLGYRILPQLSAGFAFQVLMVKARAIEIQNTQAGTQPTSDALATVETKDYFIPSVTFSIHAKPIRPVDLVVMFHYTEDFHGSGQLVYETNTFHRGATSGTVPYQNEPIPINDIRVGLPWQLNAGARYAGLLSKKKTEGGAGLGDPMDTELWDIEVDAGYQLNGLLRNSIDVGHGIKLGTRQAGQGVQYTDAASVSAVELDPHRTTAYTARLGGSYSVLPRELQVHGGAFFESRSVEAAYADIDTFAFQRIGFGLGGVLRLGSFDLRAAFSHIFSETLEVAPPPHQPVEQARYGNPRSGFDQRVGGTFGPDGTRQGGTVLPDPTAPAPGNADAVAAKTQESAVATLAQPNRVINAGKYTANFDILSVGVVYHF